MYDHDQHAFEPIDPAEIGPARSALIVLGAAAAVVALLAYGIYLNRSEEQHRAEQRRLKAFAAVKAGRGGDVSVADGQLIAMLALDPECVANCTTLVFTNVDFADEGFQFLSELKNLADVGVYSSDNVDLMLAYLHESTALEKTVDRIVRNHRRRHQPHHRPAAAAVSPLPAGDARAADLLLEDGQTQAEAWLRAGVEQRQSQVIRPQTR